MKKLFLKSLALVAMLLCGLTASASAVDWNSIDWAGDGAGGGKFANKYKVATPNGVTLVNIQNSGDWAKETGFYIIFPDDLFGEFRIDGEKTNYGVQGAGVSLYISNFTAKETEVQVMNRDNSDVRWTLYVYYDNGIETGGEEKENIKPEMGEASLAEVSHNAAVINVVGTDQETKDGEDVAVTRFKVVYGETSKTYTATDGKITITGLTAGTEYSFEIYAVDAVGNVSDNFASVKATTESRESQCSGECGHYGNLGEKRIAYTIAYNPTKKTVVYIISALKERKLDYMEVQTTKGSYRVDIPTNAATTCTYTQTGVTEGEELGIRFLYSTEDMVGNEMTAEQVSMSDPNIIYYKVGECPMEEDAEAPVMKNAELVSNTYNSAVIAVEATDNKGVVSYKVVDAEKEFNANFAAVEGNITVTGLTPGTTYNLAISAVDLVGNVSENAISVQVKTPMYSPAPTTAAPVPAHEAAYVMSIYSDTYTPAWTKLNSYNEEWWQNPSMEEKNIDGNKFLRYYGDMSGMVGWQFTPINAEGMTHLHVDIWPSVTGTITMGPTYGGGDLKTHVESVALEVVQEKWNSFDIDLTEHKNLDLTSIFQNQFTGYSAQSEFSVDNVYFWKDGTSTAVDANEVAPKVSKMIENGQVVIIREGVKYNVVGAVIEK